MGSDPRNLLVGKYFNIKALFYVNRMSQKIRFILNFVY
jgi:hypothetical protein